MRKATAIVFLLLILLVGYAYYETNTIEIRTFEMGNSFLREALGGLKVTHLSDLHIRRIDSREKKLIEVFEREKPDLIFITGDNIGFKGSYEPALAFFSQLKAPLGIYAVLGNTEYSNENGSCILCHEKGSRNLRAKPKPTFLRNSAIPITINGKTINILGIDDPVGKKGDLTAALRHVSSYPIESSNPRILEPSFSRSPASPQHFSGSGTPRSKPHAPSALSSTPRPLESLNPAVPAAPQRGDTAAHSSLQHRSTLLLSHSPEIFEEASNQGIDFILAGHNHGGQIFFIKYLRKIMHLDPTLEFIEGFYQQGKTLMYVSRGVGTSYLPFRLGVKPEITLFRFANGSSNSDCSAIASSPSSSYFAGFSFLARFDLFDFFGVLSNTANYLRLATKGIYYSMRSLLGLEPCALSPVPLLQSPNSSVLATSGSSKEPYPVGLGPYAKVLFDFELEEDLQKLDWQCHKWFELTEDHVTSGKFSLRMELPAGQYSGINFHDFPADWSKGQNLRMDVFNPSKERIIFHIRIDDKNSGWEYENRFDKNHELREGMNHISVPLSSLKTNLHSKSMDLRNIKRFMVFLPNNQVKRELFLDNIRLE